MKIIQIKEPVFEHNGIRYYVDSRMYKDLTDFQHYIDEMEKKGATVCYFYSLYTQHEKEYTLGKALSNRTPEIIYGDKDYIIYWVRCKFIK